MNIRDPVVIAAFVVAGASLLFSALNDLPSGTIVQHGIGLCILLAFIAFPDVAARAFRHSWQGRAHRGPEPQPAVFVRIAAWMLLITVVVMHHWRFSNPRFRRPLGAATELSEPAATEHRFVGTMVWSMRMSNCNV
jgi:hypothetical protein